MFSPMKQFSYRLFIVPFTGRQRLPGASKTPQRAVIDLGNWHFLHPVLLFVVWIMVSETGSGAPWQGHGRSSPWAVSVVRERIARSPSGSTANPDVALVN